MEFALRLANDVIGYPLPTAGAAAWHETQTEADGAAWVTRVDLPPVPPGHIIVPSFCQIDARSTKHQFELRTGRHDWPLNPVPASEHSPTASGHTAQVSCHIDCWHTHSPLEQSARWRGVLRGVGAGRRYGFVSQDSPSSAIDQLLQFGAIELDICGWSLTRSTIPHYLRETSRRGQRFQGSTKLEDHLTKRLPTV